MHSQTTQIGSLFNITPALGVEINFSLDTANSVNFTYGTTTLVCFILYTDNELMTLTRLLSVFLYQ